MPGNIINITPEDVESWPTPNYVDPVERNWMPIYCGILHGAATLMLGLRIWLRAIKLAGGLGLDDALLVFAWIAASANTVVTILCTAVYNADRHVWDVPLEMFENIAKMAWIAELAFLLTGGATKISILLFYRRLVAGTYNKWWKWAVISAIIFTAAWTLAFVLALILNCRPTEAYWKAFDPYWPVDFHCADTTVNNLLAGVFAAVSDLYAVALPCLMTRDFELPRRQMVALNVIFCLGLVVVGASGVRTYYLWEVGHAPDISWQIFNVFIWAELELELGIMCASLPALRVFFRKYLSVTMSRITRSNNSNFGSSNRRSRRISSKVDAENQAITTEHELQDREEYERKTQPSEDQQTMTEADMESVSPSTAPSEIGLVKGPADYEAYSRKNMDKYRESFKQYVSERQEKHRNFSRPSQRSWTSEQYDR